MKPRTYTSTCVYVGVLTQMKILDEFDDLMRRSRKFMTVVTESIHRNILGYGYRSLSANFVLLSFILTSLSHMFSCSYPGFEVHVDKGATLG